MLLPLLLDHPLKIQYVLLGFLLLSFNAKELVTADQPSKSYFLIGNSLTWDTAPSRLDWDVQWHVDCGKSLPFIFENPQEPCVKTSTLWPDALRTKQYDFLSLQSHYGATLDEDLAVISKWIEMQPEAVIVIHTGWAHHAKRAEEYDSRDVSGPMRHSPAYFAALLERLTTKYPKREFRQTHAIDLLARVARDVEAGQSPLTDVAQLHRDKIHVTVDQGRYLMHNAMRRALGQPVSAKGFEKVSVESKNYLDAVLAKTFASSP